MVVALIMVMDGVVALAGVVVAMVVVLVVQRVMLWARTWPLIRSTAPICRTLASLADLYGGPVFTLHVGFRRTHVVSTWEALKECFTINDKFLASRPTSALGKYIGKNYAMFGLSPNGPYWRQMRKILIVELLSSTKLSELSHVRVSEVATFIKELHTSALSAKRIMLNDWFFRLMMNVISSLVATKRFAYSTSCTFEDEAARKTQRTFKDLMYAAGQIVISDAIPLPLLEQLDPQGHVKMMKRVSKDIDHLVGGWMEEHRQQQRTLSSQHQDFIDAMLALAQRGEIKSDNQYTADTKINALVRGILVGAIDSTSMTLTWLVSLLLNHPNVSKRAVEELDRVVGRDRWANDSDIKNLVYLQAIVKETLRLYPATPLLLPHVATESCSVAGHRVKKGDQVLVNVWKVHRDQHVWKGDPLEFNPDRFFEIEKEGREFWFAPFGYGRRSCPGSELALQVLHLTIARLVQGFELSTPTGEPTDMGEGLGITLPKALPLEVKLNPRLSIQMYAY